MALTTCCSAPTRTCIYFVEANHIVDRTFSVRRRVGRKWEDVHELVCKGQPDSTLTALFEAARADAEQHGAQSYRFYAHELPSHGQEFHTFRLDPTADDSDENEVSKDQLSQRQLAQDYRQLALDTQDLSFKLAGIIPKVLVESGRTASTFSRSFHEINSQAREQAQTNVEIEESKEASKRSGEAVKEVTDLIKDLVGAGALGSKAPVAGPIAWLNEKQQGQVRESETLCRLFLGEKPAGDLLALLLHDHSAGALDDLLASLNDEQRGNLSAHFGVPAKLFQPSTTKADAKASADAPG